MSGCLCYHRITESAELEGTYQDNWVQLLALPTSPKNHLWPRAWCCDHSLGGLFWCPTTLWVKNPVKAASKLRMNEFVSTLWTACECVRSEVSGLMVSSDHQAFSSVCFGSDVVQSIFKLRRNAQNLNIFVLTDNKTIVNHWIVEQIKWNWLLSLFECVLDIKLTVSDMLHLV